MTQGQGGKPRSALVRSGEATTARQAISVTAPYMDDETGHFGLSKYALLWHSTLHVARAWWRSHPFHLVVEVAEPLLGKYAKANPLKILGVAAGIGVLIVLTRPWRLISLTGVLVGAIKSTRVSGLMASLASRSSQLYQK